MKLINGAVFGALLAHAATARFMERDEVDNPVLYPAGSEPEKFLIETSPGETRWVTEDEKWSLRRAGQRFMDVTDAQTLGSSLRAQSRRTAVFPTALSKKKEVDEILGRLSKANMQANLEKLTSFHTRYYKSDYGRQSSEWLLDRVHETIRDADAAAVVAAPFPHAWAQSSLIATIPGKTNRTIVVGAHQDSINLWLPSVLPAPGADDDGSGTVTILEAFRALLEREDLLNGEAVNTIEFHWYSAEEGGLLGSQDVFKRYEADKRDVRAMLQQDMTGFVQGTLDAGLQESVGIITDFVDPQLTAFVKLIVEEYCNIPWVETKCGYACSDHASASKAGYPSAFAIEAAFVNSNSDHIHGVEDLIKYLSFDHMLEHARMTAALAYELAYADFDKLDEEATIYGLVDL